MLEGKSPTAIGEPTNRAARLCAEAGNDQILISQRVYARVDQLVEAELIGLRDEDISPEYVTAHYRRDDEDILRNGKRLIDAVELVRGERGTYDWFLSTKLPVYDERLGIIGLWDDPYKTMAFRYQAAIVRALGRFVEQDMVYKGKKPVHWCTHCRTALAEAEVEYEPHTSPSI